MWLNALEFGPQGSQFFFCHKLGQLRQHKKNGLSCLDFLVFALLVRAVGEGRSKCLLEISSYSFSSALVACEHSVRCLDGGMASLSQGFSSWRNKSKTAMSWVTLPVAVSFSVALSAGNPWEWVLWASLGCRMQHYMCIFGWNLPVAPWIILLYQASQCWVPFAWCTATWQRNTISQVCSYYLMSFILEIPL